MKFKKIEVIGRYGDPDGYGFRIITYRPKLQIHLPKMIDKNMIVGTKFKIIIKELGEKK